MEFHIVAQQKNGISHNTLTQLIKKEFKSTKMYNSVPLQENRDA